MRSGTDRISDPRCTMNLLLLNRSYHLRASWINPMTSDCPWAIVLEPTKSLIWKLLHDIEIYPRLLHHLRSTSTKLHQLVNAFPRCSKLVELRSIRAFDNWRKLCIIQVAYWVTWAQLGPPSHLWWLNTNLTPVRSLNWAVQIAFPLP